MPQDLTPHVDAPMPYLPYRQIRSAQMVECEYCKSVSSAASNCVNCGAPRTSASLNVSSPQMGDVAFVRSSPRYNYRIGDYPR